MKQFSLIRYFGFSQEKFIHKRKKVNGGGKNNGWDKRKKKMRHGGKCDFLRLERKMFSELSRFIFQPWEN